MNNLGPVEYLVVGFAGTRFTGDIAPALAELLKAGLVRIVDLAIVSRDSDGNVSISEMQELDPEVAAGLVKFECSLGGLLSEADLNEVGNGLGPDTNAMAMLVEHLWATRFATAVRAAGGELILSERIPHAVVEEAQATLDAAGA